MNEEIAGYVWVDVYLLLEKVKFNNFNVSITDKGITLDMLLSEFEDLDSYSLPDLYAGARRDVERYADALKEPLNDILRPLFESHTAVMSDTPEAFVEALHDVNDNHAKDDIESALDYISDAKCEFVKELKYQFSNLEYLEPEIIDFCPRYDVCRDTVKVIAAGYDCVEVTSKMYLNVTLDATVKHINQDTADKLASLLATVKSSIEDVVNYIETQYHISIEYDIDIA